MSESDSSNPAGDDKTDDLLAQLAGEEVDRLLAEADISQAPTAEQADQIDEQEAAALTSMLEESAQQELDNITRGETATTEAPANESASAPTTGHEDVSAQLDQLFAALTTSKKGADLEMPAAPAPAPASTSTEVENDAVATEEKSALSEEAAQVEELSPTREKKLAWWAQPLAWINAPFASVSEKTREKMGWIGIQTIVFALLILAYVWWMRGKK